MPAHLDIANLVNHFEWKVHLISGADRDQRGELCAQAFELGAKVLDEVIRELETIEEYENILQHYSPEVARKVLGTKEALQRFLDTEWILLHISGWHHSQIEQVTEYIASNLRQLQQPSQIQSLLQDGLRWLKDEMNRLSQEIYQAAWHADWLQKLVTLFGGIALILIDVKAITLIGDAYAVVSAGIGVNIVSTEISELRQRR